jgi:hypothetical protein
MPSYTTNPPKATHQDRRTLRRLLRERPYLRQDLIPLAALLCEREYHDTARNQIVDAVAAGIALPELVADGLLEPQDLADAAEALLKGRRRRKRSRTMRSVGDLLNVLVRSLCSAGLEPEEGSVDASGFSVRVGGVPLRLAVVRPVCGGAPDVADDVDWGLGSSMDFPATRPAEGTREDRRRWRQMSAMAEASFAGEE